MSTLEGPIYTYRCGEKVLLNRRSNEFVVRALPDELPRSADPDSSMQMSSRSTRIRVNPDELEARMNESSRLAPTFHSYELADTREEFLITDRFIVTFIDELTPEEVSTFAGKYGLETVYQFKANKYVFRQTRSTGIDPVALVVKLTEEESIVSLAEHDLNYRVVKANVTLPTDPSYNAQWHLHQRSNSADFDPRSSSNCEQAWQFLGNFGDPNVVVGFTDDGCRIDHPDFDSGQKFEGWGYFEGIRLRKMGDASAREDRMYQTGSDHGTSVGGVIAAEIDGIMTVGAAPGVKLLPIKWESQGPSLFISDTKLLIALDYMADKVDVMANSWGVVPVARFSQDVIDRLDELSRTGGRRGKGIVFMWAAGNENCPINHQANQPVPYTSGWEFRGGAWEWVGVRTSRSFINNKVPLPGVMHIAALASTAQRSHYSNYGSGVDVTASSSNSHAYFRLGVRGLGITTTVGAGSQITSEFGGTSSATPLAAGIAALIITANPALSALEVISVLKRTASKDLNMQAYPRTPSASYDPNTSWDVSPVAPFDSGAFQNIGSPEGTWSPWFGHGKVDAFAAVQAVSQAGNNGKRLKLEKQSNVAIPDADPSGIVSRLFVEDQGSILNLTVGVNIQHTYIGDLVVRLVGPGGDKVTLHQRAGSSKNNLNQLYTPDTVNGLASFKGQEIQGTWSLEVADFSRLDTGTLINWSLEAELGQDESLLKTSSPSLKIPDNDTQGVSDTIRVDDMRVIKDMVIEVDITHTWVGDLKIELQGPLGEKIVLQSQEGRESDQILRRYRPSDLPALNQFIGSSAQGNWTLFVSDVQFRDTGKLNRWAIKIS